MLLLLFPTEGRPSRNASVSSSCAPPPTPRTTAGYLCAFSVPGWGISKFCLPRGSVICYPRGQTKAFYTYTVSYPNFATQRIILEKQADWLICQGRQKIGGGLQGHVLYFMHAFLHYLSTQNYIAKSGAIEVNQCFYGY